MICCSISEILSHVIGLFRNPAEEAGETLRRKTENWKETSLWHKTKWSTKVQHGALTPTHVPAAGGEAVPSEIITQPSATQTKPENLPEKENSF